MIVFIKLVNRYRFTKQNDPAMEIYSWFDYFRQNIFKTRGQIEREPSETICGFDSACGSEVHCDCRFQRILIAS